MNLGIEGKRALVTGASRGLGAAIARTLADEGARVAVVARSKNDLDSLVAGMSGMGHLPLVCDFERGEAIDQLIAALDSSSFDPDIVINNVGGNLGITDPFSSVIQWRQVFQLNLEASISLNAHYVPRMQKRRWGRVCHISSISALENQGPPAYCAAKAALNAYVRSLGRYVAADNVILTTVMPGAVMTEGGYWDDCQKNRPEHVKRYLEDRMAIKRFGTPEEISHMVAFLCSEHASFCVGSQVLVDGGQGRCFFEG